MLITSEPRHAADVSPQASLAELGFNEGEIALLRIKHFQNADKFTRALWDLLMLADANEMAKLVTIYPHHVQAYEMYKTIPGWYELLVERIPQRRLSDIIS